MKMSKTDESKVLKANANVEEIDAKNKNIDDSGAGTATSIINKNDIVKVTVEGVAKLSFAFLEEMQGGDSSLEPGEVKTPTPGSSPVMCRDVTPTRADRDQPPSKQLAKESLAKALKTVSQMEAEACEEKVRAILELDAKRRKEEIEKRKQEADRRRQSGELDSDEERKRRAKEERKRLKKLKKGKFQT